MTEKDLGQQGRFSVPAYTTPERLAFAYLARKNSEIAILMVESLESHKDEALKVRLSIEVGSKLAQVDIVPSTLISYLEDVSIIRQPSVLESLNSRAQEGLAKIRATLQGEQSVETEDQIKARHPSEPEALREITRVRLGRNDIDGAIITALEMGSVYFIAQTAAEAAVINAQQGKDTEWLLVLAQDGLNQPFEMQLSIKGEEYYHWNEIIARSELCATLGRAGYLTGEDPNHDFNLALMYASLFAPNEFMRDEYQSFVYNKIARNQALSGIDATDVWQLAAAPIEYHLDSDEDLHFTTEAGYIECMEDIVRAQIECGYYTLAIKNAEKILTYKPKDPDSLLFLVDSIVGIATTQVHAGLSETEVNILSAVDVQAVLNSENEHAKQAIAYFGLAA